MAHESSLSVSEVDGGVEENQRNIANGFRACPKDFCGQYESERREPGRLRARPCIPKHEAFHALVEVVAMDAFLEATITTKVYRDD